MIKNMLIFEMFKTKIGYNLPNLYSNLDHNYA